MTRPRSPTPGSETRFPDAFLWGAATSAYQIEGSPLADGAGPSIWHRFAHTPGMVQGGATGDVACDHYRRMAADVALMHGLGLTAYRFSIAWGRILPTGRGPVNARGLGFYERLVDTLLGSNIQPLITLYHWDLPAALEDRGGWLNPDSVGWFADYAETVVRALDDRVRLWTTLNEPWVVSDRGYLSGVFAPGHRNVYEAARVAHHLLRAHAAAVSAYRGSGRHEIGLVVNLEPQHPASRRTADREAASRADAYLNRQFLDPVFKGTYPAELPHIYGAAWPDPAAAETGSIAERIDFLGVNYYSRRIVRADPTALPTGARQVPQPQGASTDMGWEVYPTGLTAVLQWVRQRYGNMPVYVTENGAAFRDPPTRAGEVIDDRRRVAYLRSHLGAAHAALRSGVDLRGYFAWSLLDNFEWSYGYTKRFGLVHVDFATQRRTLRASARFYADVIRTGGTALDDDTATTVRGARRDLRRPSRRRS